MAPAVELLKVTCSSIGVDRLTPVGHRREHVAGCVLEKCWCLRGIQVAEQKWLITRPHCFLRVPQCLVVVYGLFDWARFFKIPYQSNNCIWLFCSLRCRSHNLETVERYPLPPTDYYLNRPPTLILDLLHSQQRGLR